MTDSGKTLLTDLYQLTMNAAYVYSDKDDMATFDLFIRALPPDWGYFIACGIEDAIDYLTTIRFDHEDLDYLKQHGFRDDYLEFLKDFSFEGDVMAVREGTPVFPAEPILRVTAKRTQAQFVETALLNAISFQTMIATKASRIVTAAHPARVIDFGLRRAQEESAGLKGAYAAYIGGAAATSNVKAGRLYDIPLAGTHAHSFVMSYESELEAFRSYAAAFPDSPTLLIDTYDTLQGAQHACTIARELQQQGKQLGAVRLDSGDLAQLSKDVRALFDREGLNQIKIFASSDLNEYKIHELIR
ncbi:MAG: nicotinate phosphoribosyltransferase, partial [Deltaproteobacteria bacterium]|nr:nicotinate phosphoribosyltransferase [Deltaproteobacteria bacterium]